MDDNILQHISQLLKHSPQNFSIIEEQIDIDIQMEYFSVSRSIKELGMKDSLDVLRNDLFNGEIGFEDKKRVLATLASMENVEAYRSIEQYYNSVEGEEQTWASLALRESKMMLETSLLDEKQVLISTGLGGKGTKLRYFIVLMSKIGSDYSETQHKIIKNEFEFILKEVRGELESIEFDGSYAKLLALIPIEVAIKDTLKQAVDECNVYGDFVLPNFIITNVKIFTTDEIERFLTEDDEEDDASLGGNEIQLPG